MPVSVEGVLHKKRASASLSHSWDAPASQLNESDIWVPGLGRLFFDTKK